ncbi:MAG: helix-turn-helix transcriptional regulator [Alphaproteobacteria bacterium]|nr:helix-turn-helix transcriptional regulator [Alphaproteobacteria bacterium]
MTKTRKRVYSAYSQDAMGLLGATIRAERKAKKMTEPELAERVGVSRSLIQRIERGDMNCGIGLVFEAAYILGIPLFEAEPSRLTNHILDVIDRLTLLPKTIRKKNKVINDEF